jgi:uncharacterized protein (DUF2252 family)
MASVPSAHPLPNPEYLPRHGLAERRAQGQDLRERVPHERHAGWVPSASRVDPISVLERQGESRIEELLPIRYGRMAASPFAFFRGGAAIMAADLSGTAVGGLRAQLCGDAHLLNFGMFETPERSLAFGLNDFDETLPGPIEWDVKRLATSIEIAGRDLGFEPADRRRAVLTTVQAYREAMLSFAEQRNIEVWTARLHAEELRLRLAGMADRRSHHAVKKSIDKALRHDHLSAFDKLIERKDGDVRFINDPPLLVPVEELLDGDQRSRYVEVVTGFLEQYRESLTPHLRALVESYRFVHMARKVVGVGSVGTRAWVVLFEGRDAGDPLLLQLKEAQHSVLEPYAGASAFSSQGRRVVEGQRFMQTSSDSLLGWYRLNAFDGKVHDFYVRQLWDGKASIDVTKLTAAGLRAYGDSCGWTLARAHARSGDRVAMAAFLGDDDAFDCAIADFATTYADLNEADHARLVAAVDRGNIPATPGI